LKNNFLKEKRTKWLPNEVAQGEKDLKVTTKLPLQKRGINGDPNKAPQGEKDQIALGKFNETKVM